MTRAATLTVHSYEVHLILDEPDEHTFRTATTISFTATTPSTYADLVADSIDAATLNGRQLDISRTWQGSRLQLADLSEANVLHVDGRFRYATTGRGLRTATDPDGTRYRYLLTYPTASPSVLCCFDEPTLRAKVNLRLSVPSGWTSLVNGTSALFAPYLLAGAAGPWARLASTRGYQIPIAVYTQGSRANERDRGRYIVDLLARSIAAHEAALGVPYPYEKIDAVFVRDLPSLALAAPGMILFADRVLDLIETRGEQYAVTVLAHEVAHSWFGGLVDWADAPWLVEACATYLARNAALDLVPGSRPWDATEPSAPDAGYGPDAERIRALEATIGKAIVLRGLHLLCQRFPHRNATPDDLAACWSELSGHDLTNWPH